MCLLFYLVYSVSIGGSVYYSSFGNPLLASASALHWRKEGEVMGDGGRGGAEEGEGRGCADGALGVVVAKGSTGAALFKSSDWADDLLL